MKQVWDKIQIPFYSFLGIYILLFLFSIFQSESYSPFFKKFLKQSESGDFWMLLIFPASFLIASIEKKSQNLKKIFIHICDDHNSIRLYQFIFRSSYWKVCSKRV
ncbi:hypothetical protein LEP1GSC151_3330 [Leptospira interrogans serovar Grippotyphosa str. LT2186]|uniref:Uncharacterized protein n=1 Tax=Leptospira interrogans serovar Grippotyphosa str. LT2186 TaxID=1001599 RepID=M3IBX3_LEPIR|nr:hypothetical protein LEP1GSC151_3330 [Leptospira interrogans serovar Grippotyphosa str. LT2186]